MGKLYITKPLSDGYGTCTEKKPDDMTGWKEITYAEVRPSNYPYTDEEDYLKFLLNEDVIFTNNGHWDEKWPKDAVSLHVGCNDVFAWGCADAEDITHGELKDLYEHVQKDPHNGAAVWCMKKRQMWPQQPVEDYIREQGIWDLDKILPAKTGILNSIQEQIKHVMDVIKK